MVKHILLYGKVDKRPIVLGLIKLLQGFGDVLFITREHHYYRLTAEKEEIGYLQNVIISTVPETPDTVFDILEESPDAFDFIIWDCDEYLPSVDPSITYALYSYDDEFLDDDTYDLLTDPIRVKLKYDGKAAKGDYNININLNLVKYVELAESYGLLPPFKFKDISKLFSDTLAEMLDVTPKNIVKYLESGGKFN